jgi:hypothetical protein
MSGFVPPLCNVFTSYIGITLPVMLSVMVFSSEILLNLWFCSYALMKWSYITLQPCLNPLYTCSKIMDHASKNHSYHMHGQMVVLASNFFFNWCSCKPIISSGNICPCWQVIALVINVKLCFCILLQASEACVCPFVYQLGSEIRHVCQHRYYYFTTLSFSL